MTGRLLSEVAKVFATTPPTQVLLPDGVANPTVPAAPESTPNVLVIPTDDTGTINIPTGYDYVVYNGTGSLTGGDSGTAIIGENLTYNGPAGTVLGTGGAEMVTDNTSNAVLSFFTGALSLVASGGSDTVNFDTGVTGAETISGNNDLINIRTPSSLVGTGTILPGADTLGLAGANDTINIAADSSLIFVLGNDTFNQVGGAATIVTGHGSVVTLNATGGSDVVYDNAGGNMINGGMNTEFIGAAGGATNTYDAMAGGADTVFAVTSMTYNGGDAASTLFIGGAGAATVFAGTAATIYGGTGGGSYTEGTGSFFFQGGGAADTILGGASAASVTVWGNSNENTTVSQLGSASGGQYVAFGQADTLNAMDARGGNTFTVYDATLSGGVNFSGDSTLVGSSAGSDAFDIEAGTTTTAHTITIENWQASDTLNLNGFSAADVAAADNALASAGGSGATFTLSDNTTIKFVGASPTHT